MKHKIVNIFLILFHLGFISSQTFIADLNCIYKEAGAPFAFDVTPHIDFYIPHNWVNNDDKESYLHIKMFSTDLVLRHPSSSTKNPNEISLPLDKLKVGWNTIFLRKEGNILQVVVRSPEDFSISVIQTIDLPPLQNNNPGEDPLYVSGLFSLVDCLKDLNTRYYKIPAGTSVKIPYVMFKQVDRFDAHSESNPFSFDVTINGKRHQICKEEVRNAPDVFSIPKICRHWPATRFSQNTIYNVFMYPDTFEPKDILSYNDFTFSEFIVHNTGDTDFNVRTFIKPNSNAPISYLKGQEPPTSPEMPPATITTTTTSRPISPDTSAMLRKGCGVNTRKSLLNRIIGGEPANPKDWTWMAALLRKDGAFFCGGSLITDRHVLSAAHCFLEINQNQMKVRLGEYDFETSDETNPADFLVQEITIHEHYNPQTKNNDIAVLKLERPSSLNEFIWPICLPPSIRDFKSVHGIVAGWGANTFRGPASKVLKEVVIPIKNQKQCDNDFEKFGYIGIINDNMFCAGLRGQDSCQGDSGGPFMVQNLQDTRWYVKGIVSWGEGCGAELPGVYTKVANFLNWINSKTAS